MQKCVIADDKIRLLLIDVEQCLCYYVAHTKTSIRRCVEDTEDNVMESQTIFERIHSAVYGSDHNQASAKVAKTELHIVGVVLTKASLTISIRAHGSKALNISLILDGILGNAYLFTKAFQHWTHALIRMSLGLVRHPLIKLRLPSETKLSTLLANPSLQTGLNGTTPPSDTFPPQDADSDESDPLLWSSQRSSILSSPAHPVVEDTLNHLSPSKRSQEERERLEAIELIKTGQQTTPQRTTRRSKAARF
ncbi:hypothetical protein CBS14141_002942 [Malassezia furfur]|nr:hypothetical protein CBS14141_002942 [Malassezia furfur]